MAAESMDSFLSLCLTLLRTVLLTVGVTGCVDNDPEISEPLVHSDPVRESFQVMAPLVIGDPHDLVAEKSVAAWKSFASQLAEIKRLGADGVTTDVWWGLVEPKDQVFVWRYYERMADTIQKAGLNWIPILSTHQCGGNVGDTCDIPLPAWVFSKHARVNRTSPAYFKYKSEEGNVSSEVISAWTTALVIEDYKELYRAFAQHFARYANSISEINISLGPAGELRYPSYNSHDKNSGYPTRGAIQAFSAPAQASWQKYAQTHRIAQTAIKKDWFLRPNFHQSTLGIAFYQWYRESLMAHGDQLLAVATKVFAAEKSPYRRIDLGAKIPGIHWRIGSYRADTTGAKPRLVFGDRGAELSAGLITADRTLWNKENGFGYRPLLQLFARWDRLVPGTVVLHFTCLEMEDGQDSAQVQSLPSSLVSWVGAEARRQGLVIKGENALSWNVPHLASWQRMAAAMTSRGGAYRGLTILRMNDILGSDVAREQFSKLAKR